MAINWDALCRKKPAQPHAKALVAQLLHAPAGLRLTLLDCEGENAKHTFVNGQILHLL